MNLPLLYELQYLHKEMYAIINKLNDLKELKDMRKFKEEYQRLKEEYLKGEEKLKKNAYRQETRNNEIRNLDFNMKSSEGLKFSKDTNTIKKLENIEKQLEKLEEKKQAAEDDIIELINDADNINKELMETKKKLAFIKKKFMKYKEDADKAVAELEVQKAELGDKIDNIIKSIDKESLELYNKMTKTNSELVAPVKNRICGGCKMEIPAMDYEAIKAGSDKHKCQSCGRILFYQKP